MPASDDPNLSRRRRRRRAGRLLADLAHPAGPGGAPATAAREALAAIEADPALVEAVVQEAVTGTVVGVLRAGGAVEVAPGVWDVPSRPGGAA